MKTKNTILIIILAATALGIVLYFKPHTQAHAVAIRHGGHLEIWYCPMHPWIKSDKPGVCPICGMTLVAGHQHNETPAVKIPGYISIEISKQRQQLAGIRTALVGKKTVIKTIRAPARVAYDPGLYEAEVKYVEDYIASIRLDRRINQGSYTIQDTQRKLKEEELDLTHMGATEQTITQLQTNKFPDHSLLVSHGEGAQIFAEIFGEDLGFIDVGQKAIIDVPDYHETFNGVVTSVDPIIDPMSQTARVRIYIDAENDLHSNMFVNVSMQVELNEAIVVPRDAVMDTGLRKIVFIEKDDGQFEPREIQTGWETDDGFEVKSGLKTSDRIAVNGNFLLDSESRVQAGLEGDSHGS
jgi:Cu(I)/Ag(I) efflux system membrane fusion protein